MSSDARIYKNFVRASSPDPAGDQATTSFPIHFLRGEDAKRMYLEELKEENVNESSVSSKEKIHKRNSIVSKAKSDTSSYTHMVHIKDLFIAVQNNDTETLNKALNENPDHISILDDYGWSLLMIACQANSIDIAKELLKRGADTSIRDKAGNSARSLVIKNKNVQLATLLLDNVKEEKKKNHKKQRHKEEFECETCSQTFPDKQEHLSSTVHNINASRGKKITSSYKIPETNKGFQMMLKTGWDKDSGLGSSGEGRRYPIRPVEKKDRKGLGLKKKVAEEDKEAALINKKLKVAHRTEYKKNRNMEISFRREFY